MAKCPMFPEFRNDQALNILKALYCEGDYDSCARLKSFRSGVIPARTLLPDGRTLKASARR